MSEAAAEGDPTTTTAADATTTTIAGGEGATTTTVAAEPTTTVAPTGPTTTATTVAPPVTEPAPPPTAPPTVAPAVPPTTAAPSPRPTISLEDARRAGLWGRPRFDGCTSRYGDTSPSWLNDAIAASAWPSAEWGKLCRVVGCESNFHADSTSRRIGGRLLGLLQIHDRSWRATYNAMGYTDADLLRPEPNLAVGLWLWREVYGSRWTSNAWTCANA